MARIPRSHPRYESLLVRERLVGGFEQGLVAKEGLMAHGRGEAFDYLLGERTGAAPKRAIRAAAAQLLAAGRPVISVNGNAAALCPKQLVALSRLTGASLEVNLFYSTPGRKRAILGALKRAGAKSVLGADPSKSARLGGTDSARRVVDRDGIYAADVVLVPLEDGDRTAALKRAGKKVITFDLNPLSRTARAADITIVDNITRGMELLVSECKRLKGRERAAQGALAGFENKANLARSVSQIRGNLARRAGHA